MNIKTIDNTVLIPRQPDGKSFVLTANNILNVFKGPTPVSSERLKLVQENFEERQYIKLRGYERILFGTGIIAQIENGTHIQMNGLEGITQRKGLMTIQSPSLINCNCREELAVLLVNTNQYLATIEKGEELVNCIIITPETVFVQEVSKLLGDA